MGQTVYAKVITDKEEKKRILEEGHNSNMAAHSAQSKMLDKLRELFYWPNLSNDVREWVRSFYFFVS